MKITCGASSCQLGDKEVLLCHICCTHCNSFPLENYIWWVSDGKKHSSWWCAICGEKYDWRVPNRLLVVQTCDSVSQAKDVKAHAGPQGLCENLINALKLLANQQKDGDSPIQSKYCNRPLRKKQEKYYGGLEKLKKSGQ